jgi:DNA-binding GntR family transcriptional regulator
LWWNHREILRAVSRPFPFSIARRQEIIAEHRGLIAAIEAQDPDAAAAVIERHVRGSGRHIVERMRTERVTQGGRSA